LKKTSGVVVLHFIFYFLAKGIHRYINYVTQKKKKKDVIVKEDLQASSFYFVFKLKRCDGRRPWASLFYFS